MKTLHISLWALAGTLMVCLYFYLYIGVFNLELPKVVVLRGINDRWRERALLINGQMDVYETSLESVEERNSEVYRSIYGLPDLQVNPKSLLSQEDTRYSYLDKEGASPVLKRMVRRCDVMERRIYIQKRSLDEVAAQAIKAGDMVSCVPGIPPICPVPGKFRVSSSFGFRKDPIFGGREYHAGIDFASRKGTPVYVTGDGVVTRVKYRIYGYGNEIVVDHGFGYQTRYAHLSEINVAEGMKMTRGFCIGAVGSSGKSTGPHLHYEVMYKGKKMNPRNYMDLAMDKEEYLQMTAARRLENPEPRRKSNSEILKKKR